MAAVRSGEVFMEYFFGFSKFLSFQDCNEAVCSGPNERDKERDVFCSLPMKIKLADFEVIDISWANVFYLNCKTKTIKVVGNCSKDSIILPLKSKIKNISACWDKALLVTENDGCHVMSNMHGDWVINPVTSTGREKAGNAIFGSLGEGHCIVVDNDGKVYDILKDNLSNYMYKEISTNIDISQVSCGKEHVLLLSISRGTLYSYGLGSRGQLGHGSADSEIKPVCIQALTGIKITQIAAGGWHSLALSQFGDIYAWGWNNCGQLGITCVPPEVPASLQMLPYLVDFPTETCDVTDIACGSRHSVAVTSRRKVWTWGWGYYGQLGHGDQNDRNTPTLVKYFDNHDVGIEAIICGPWQTVIRTAQIA